MPTFTTIALDNLLDRDTKTQQSCLTKAPKYEDVPKHVYISPALYTTPAPAPIPEVLTDYSSFPSPYVVNHKGRRGKVEEGEGEGGLGLGGGEGIDIGGSFGVENGVLESLEYLDSVEMESVGSLNEGGSCLEGVSLGEFFDAKDDFSSDGSFSSGQSRGYSIGSEVRAIRLSLLEEMERRKTAEDTLKLMQNQWRQIGNLLAHAGLTLPALPIYGEESLEQVIQEVIVTKIVTEAMDKELARAEAELVSQTLLESKEQEISRLRDRLQYYEAVNLEMSQRNQEIVEVTRRQRQKKQRQRKWLWSCIGLSISIGTAVIASSYLPTAAKEPQLPSSCDPVDTATSSDTM